jgi:hypothetical protein
MDDIVEWFESEFGPLGFSLTPTMYNPFTFMPVKGVRFKSPSGGPMILTRIRITLIRVGYFDVPPNEIGVSLELLQEHKDLITQEIYRFLEEQGVKDFKPTKKINKLNL